MRPRFLAQRASTAFLAEAVRSSLLSALARAFPATYPWPLELANTTVEIDGLLIPLSYVGPAQVNVLIPAQIQSGHHGLTVKTWQASQPWFIWHAGAEIIVVPVLPTLFGYPSFPGDKPSSSHSWNAAALDATNSLISPSNPAVPGQIISLFATGLGVVTDDNGLQRAIVTPHVTVDGVPVTVSFAGRAPGYEGLDQINIQIPPDPPHRHLSVPVMIDGRVSSNQGFQFTPYSYISNTVMLAIQ